MLNEHQEVVRDTQTNKTLVMQTNLPLQATDASGKLAPTDLTLQESASGFKPVNSPSPVVVGRAVSDGVTFMSGDFKVRWATPNGGGLKHDKSGVFFGNAGTDTDVMETPRTFGATLDVMLRSPLSPTEQTLIVDLPPGAKLKHPEVDHPLVNDPPRSIEIEREGKAVGYIYPPLAYDADGTTVATTFKLTGNRIKITVAHRLATVRYPVMLDPDIGQVGSYPGYEDTNYNGGAANWPGWKEYTGSLSTGCAAGSANTPGFAIDQKVYAEGLYMSFPTSSCFGDGATVEAAWAAPANTFISSVNFYNFAHKAFYSAGSGGIYNSAVGWVNGVSYENNASGNPWSNAAAYSGIVGTSCYFVPAGCDGNQGYESSGSTSYAIFALSMHNPYGGPLYTTSNSANATASAITTYLGDRHPPQITTPTPPDKGWIDDSASPTHTVNVGLHDDGLGLKSLTLSGASGGDQTVTNGCTGDVYRSTCPLDIAPFGVNYTLPEGISNLSLNSRDIVDNPAGPQQWRETIDRSKPVLGALSGSLWDARDRTDDKRFEGLYNNAYSLHATATDSFSGIMSIQVFVDDAPQASTNTGTLDWTMTPGAFSDGPHTVKVVVRDNVADQPGVPDRHSDSASFPVTVDRVGDIYDAQDFDALPATGRGMSEQWNRLASSTSRLATPDEIFTRRTVPCDSNTPTGTQCDETRMRTRLTDADPSDYDYYATTIGNSTTDPALDQVDIQQVAATQGSATTDDTGPIASVLDPSQQPPPAHGTSFKHYHFADTDTDNRAFTTDVWVDAATGFPLKTTTVYAGGGDPLLSFYSYAESRSTTGEVPSDFFALARPARTGHEVAQHNGATASKGHMTTARDASTTNALPAYFLGDVASGLLSSTYCLDGTDAMDVRSDTAAASSVLDDDPDPGSDLPTPSAVGAESFVEANYRVVTSAADCVLGLDQAGDPDAAVRTYDAASAGAQRQLAAYQSAATAETQDTGSPDTNRVGIIPVLVNAIPETAYVIARNDASVSALINLGQQIVVIDGPFDKTSLPLITMLLNKEV